MDFYRPYYIEVMSKDESKVDDILDRHDAMGDLDDYSYGRSYKDKDGIYWTQYRIAPIIYEDLEIILREFERAGIQVK